MTQWLPPAILSLLCFGFWGLFSKLALEHADSRSALVLQTAGVLLVGILALSTLEFKIATNTKGISYGLLTGIAYGVGCFFYLIAAGKGKISTVVTLTALYPLITLCLSYFILREQISTKQLFGIATALFAIFLMVD